MALDDPTAPNPRAVLGGNEPPLEERTLLAFDEALNEHEGLIARIDAMEERAIKAGPCRNDDDAGKMGDFIAMTAAAAKTIEAEREILNRPLLITQRTLKARADALSGKATTAGAIVRRLLDTYLADKAEKARQEAARLAEIERQAEAARQAIIAEANRKAAAEAEAERQRLQAIEDARVAAERERLQAEEAERAAREQREAQEVVVEAAVIEVEAAPVIVAEAPRFVSAAAPVSRIQGDFGTKVSTVETWHVEIENIRQVPDMFLKNEAVLEALRKVIAPSVRGKTGLRSIKGCRIYSTLGSAVRG